MGTPKNYYADEPGLGLAPDIVADIFRQSVIAAIGRVVCCWRAAARAAALAIGRRAPM